MSKKITLELTEFQLNQIYRAVSELVASDESFWDEDMKRDASAAAYYRSLLTLVSKIEKADA
jgi:hypothetical protein